MLDKNYVELHWIIAAVRHWWWLIAGVTILAGFIAFGVTAIIPPEYEASALLLVNPSMTPNESQYNELMAGTQLALTYSQMITDRPVLEAVISKLGMKQSVVELEKHVTAEPVRSSQIIKLTVTDTKPDQAALIANTLAQAFTSRIAELSTQQYADAIKTANDRMSDLQAQMNDTQTQIDTLRSQKVTKDVDLGNKQTALTTLLSDYRSEQTSYQTLQLSVAAVTGKVYIAYPVQITKDDLQKTSIATVIVAVGQVQTPSGSDLPSDPLSYGQLIVKPPLLQGVIKELGLTATTDELAKKISYKAVTGTQMIQFTVEDTDATKAQLIAQSLVNAFLVQVKAMLAEPYSDQLASMQNQSNDLQASITSAQADISKITSESTQMAADLDRLETNITSIRSDYRLAQQSYDQIQTTAAQVSNAVVITEPAQAPQAPSQNRMLDIVLAAMLGFAVGIGLAFFLKYMDSQIRTDQDVQSTLKMTVLSIIGRAAMKNKDLIMWSSPYSLVAEDFRVLGNKIRLMIETDHLKTILVTSPVPTEGKSTIISNLGIALTRMGLRIVIIDADLHLPRVHILFNISQNMGLTNALRTGSVNGALQSTSLDDLKILTSGSVPSNPAELLTSPNLEKVLQEIKGKADLVLIDCPPVLSASDAAILAAKVDGVLLVLRSGYSKRESAREAEVALRQVKAKMIGIVLNSMPDHRKKGYYYYSSEPRKS